MTTKGRVEYHFLVLGELALLVIEFKLELGTNVERLNAIAQVIAECDGNIPFICSIIGSNSYFLACDFANYRLDFPSYPIYAVLCDGRVFEFFSFDGSTSPPTFSRGVVSIPGPATLEGLSLADYATTTDIHYMRSLRPVCEVLFYFLLLTYATGVHAYWLRSTGEATRTNRPRESTPGWAEADKFASMALSQAKVAAMMAATHDPAANEETQVALDHLQRRFLIWCSSFRSQHLLIV